MRILSTLLIAAAVGALAAPALASAAPSANGTRGVIVQRDARAGVVVVATHSGSLVRVKFAKPNSLKMGSVIRVRGSKVKVVGHSRTAKLHGVVLRRHNKSFALADSGSVVAVTSPTPPAAGQQVTATVQVTPTELDDDNGDEQVSNAQVAGVVVRGNFISASPTTLVIAIPGPTPGTFLNLPIDITGQTILQLTPQPALNTPVEARVTFAPVTGTNPNAIALTLVSLQIDGTNNQQGNEHGGFVKAEGLVTAVTEATTTATGLITINDGDHGPITFIIPIGFGPTGAMVNDEVDAKGTPAPATSTGTAGMPTLVRLEVDGNNNNGSNSNNNGNNNNGSGDNGDESGGGHSSGDGSGGND